MSTGAVSIVNTAVLFNAFAATLQLTSMVLKNRWCWGLVHAP
jgi:hypothetical protein